MTEHAVVEGMTISRGNACESALLELVNALTNLPDNIQEQLWNSNNPELQEFQRKAIHAELVLGTF